MDSVIRCPVVMAHIMNLGMTVMAAGDAVICAGCDNLIVFEFAVITAGIRKP